MQNSGLIGRAQNAAIDYATKQKQEESDMNDLDKRLQELMKNIGNSSGGSGGKTGPKSEYKKVGNTYCNSPDLSGFNAECTWYVTYDSSGENETIAGRVDVIDTPTEWYDYGTQKWANVVTVNDCNITYWVWIPRYKYKLNADGQTVDVKFVSIEDECTEIVDGQDGQVVDVSDYSLPEGFSFGGEKLAGYWVSKYDVQNTEAQNQEQIYFQTVNGEAQVTTSSPNGKYTVYINGIELDSGVELPYKLKGLNLNSNFDVTLFNETQKKMIGRKESKAIGSEVEIDLSGFNPACTKYVTYDSSGENEKIGDNIKLDESGKATNMPNDWYNYDMKRWANIVTENDGLTTYWTYIPRYEYKTWTGSQTVEVKFIPRTQTTADEGYKIPEAFTFGGENLAGYWVSKYDVQEGN